MRIGVDLDGVIVDSIPRWIEVLNRGSGRKFGPYELPPTHSTPELAAYSDRNELEMLLPVQPVAGAVRALQHLRRRGQTLVAVTARAPRLRRLTEAWLDYFGIEVDQLYFLEGASKAPVAVTERLDLLVEDTPHQALAVAAAGIPVLLFAAPYNSEATHPFIRRCDGWAAVVQEIEGLERLSRPASQA